ncbi:unnamed protein product [Nippostrongylus brasiliensis]|uniref:Uncharacterized protein n=1 Tax=Nippostrongylus brasiliensis TaxID=27835 RepID=A0A0N4XLR2_NIPBR|nr:unnamed protein product [Nippostrongylus brasiliensis]
MLASSPMMASSTKRRDLDLNTHRSDKFEQNVRLPNPLSNFQFFQIFQT